MDTEEPFLWKWALLNSLCKFKNSDKNIMMERHDKIAAPIFVQYT